MDSGGRRFCNESNSYVEVGKAMYANKAVPCWMIFDDGYVRRYVAFTEVELEVSDEGVALVTSELPLAIETTWREVGGFWLATARAVRR